MPLRRLLVGLLTVAVTQFGVMATAPAHAHAEGGGHGVREMVLVHDHEAPAGHHDDNEDPHGPHSDVDAGGVDGSPPVSGENNHGEHAHVHVFPQFAPLAGQAPVSAPLGYRELVWPLLSTLDVSHSTYPPRRPPRNFL